MPKNPVIILGRIDWDQRFDNYKFNCNALLVK